MDLHIHLASLTSPLQVSPSKVEQTDTNALSVQIYYYVIRVCINTSAHRLIMFIKIWLLFYFPVYVLTIAIT